LSVPIVSLPDATVARFSLAQASGVGAGVAAALSEGPAVGADVGSMLGDAPAVHAPTKTATSAMAVARVAIFMVVFLLDVGQH
jgi:hypothetical protein